MQYGICPLSIIPLRAEPRDTSELVSQILYGEFFKVLEQRKKWSRIRLAHDKYEGWIDNKQYLEISKEEYQKFDKENPQMNGELVDFVTNQDGQLLPVPQGAVLNGLEFLSHRFDGIRIIKKSKKNQLIKTALLYLNAPYLWGGRTHFGIDCSGFTQIVYKLNGHRLLRDASQQATQGEPLSFIEESEPGDLAFFDNDEGIITHVGIMMADHHIIHAHGQVRIDHIDHTGIYNAEQKKHTHKLRVIKKIIK